MTPLVIDASAALAYLLGEPDGDRVEREFEARDVVLAPWVVWSEVINVLARRHRWPGSDVLASVYRLEQLGIQTQAPSRQSMLAVIDAVEAHGLTAYDAEYLVLAETADADLLTGDAFLAAAAGSRAILIGTRHRLAEVAATYEHERRATDVDWPRWPGAAAYIQELRREAMSELAGIGTRQPPSR